MGYQAVPSPELVLSKFVSDTFVEQMDRWNDTMALLDNVVSPLWLLLVVCPEDVYLIVLLKMYG